MSKIHSGYLKAITGVVLIRKDGNDILCCLEDMQSTKHFTIGQIFNAVRVLNGKTIEQYGRLWPKFKTGQEVLPGEDTPTSNDWKHLQSVFESTTDYEFFVEACNQLQEEVPEVITRAAVEKQIQLFKETILDAAASVAE